MQLPPSLRALLGPLGVHLENQAISEILLPGDGAVRLRSAERVELAPEQLSAGQVRALARALLAQGSGRGFAAGGSQRARTLVLGPYEVTVLERGGEEAPVLRFLRRALPGVSLDDLVAAGSIERELLRELRRGLDERRSLLIAGRAGSGKTALLAAVGRELAHERTVAVLEEPGGVLTPAMVGHLRLDPALGVNAARALGAEVLVADEPGPPLLRELLLGAHSFVISLQAPSAHGGVLRLLSLLMETGASREQAELLVQSGLERVAEVACDRAHPRVMSLFALTASPEPAGAPVRFQSIGGHPGPRAPSLVRLGAAPVAEMNEDDDRGEPASPRGVPRSSLFPDKDAGPAGDALGHVASPMIDELADIRAENLVSQSFVMSLDAIGVPPAESSQEVQVVSVERTPPPPAITRPLPVAPTAAEAGVLEAEVETSHGLAAELPSSALESEDSDEATEGTGDERAMVEPAPAERELSEARRVRRQAAERMPTVVGDGAPPEASARGLERSAGLATYDEQSIGPGFEQPVSPFGSWADQEFARMAPGEEDRDSTQAARLSEMVSGRIPIGALATLHPDDGELRTQAHESLPPDEPDEGDVASGRRRGPFDELTPVSPLLEGQTAERAGVATLEARAPAGDAAAGPPRVEPRPASIDPVQAARVSVAEFDALLDEIRDVTHQSPFVVEGQETEAQKRKNGSAKPAAKEPAKGRIIGGDAKRRIRGRPE